MKPTFFIFNKIENLPQKQVAKKTIEIDGKENQNFETFYANLSKLLDFDTEFGDNLDALFDNLADLSWIKEKEVEIIFKNTSSLLSEEEVEMHDIFLNTLNDAAEAHNAEPLFEDFEPKTLTFYFQHTLKIENLFDRNFLIWENVD